MATSKLISDGSEVPSLDAREHAEHGQSTGKDTMAI